MKLDITTGKTIIDFKENKIDLATHIVKIENDCLIAYEKTDWENVIGKYPLNLIEDERFLLIYMEALGWAVQMSAQYSI